MSPSRDTAAGTPAPGDLLADAPAPGTFVGVSRCDDVAALDAHVAIIGAPVAMPYPSLGAYAAGAPRAIRDGAADFAGAVRHEDFDLGGCCRTARGPIVDCGDLDGDEADAAGNRARIECFDVVEFMPARDRDGAGARTAARLVCSADGLLARQALAR